jgi:hypothetical protein
MFFFFLIQRSFFFFNKLFDEFHSKFPEIFEAVERNQGADTFDAREVFNEKNQKKEIKETLVSSNSAPINSTTTTPTTPISTTPTTESSVSTDIGKSESSTTVQSALSPVPYHQQRLTALREWLSTLPTLTLPLVADDLSLMSDQDVMAAEQKMLRHSMQYEMTKDAVPVAASVRRK